MLSLASICVPITFYGRYLQPNSPVCRSHIVQQLVGIFTNHGFFMIASDIVPCNAVVVDVIKDRKTGFVGSVDVEFGVVRLRLFLVSGLGPRVVAEPVRSPVCGRHLFSVCGPEPSEYFLGFEILTVFASFEIAQATRGPDVRYIILKYQRLFIVKVSSNSNTFTQWISWAQSESIVRLIFVSRRVRVVKNASLSCHFQP